MLNKDFLTILATLPNPTYVLEDGTQVTARAVSAIQRHLVSNGHRPNPPITEQYLVDNGYTIHYARGIHRGILQGKIVEVLVIPDL